MSNEICRCGNSVAQDSISKMVSSEISDDVRTIIPSSPRNLFSSSSSNKFPMRYLGSFRCYRPLLRHARFLWKNQQTASIYPSIGDGSWSNQDVLAEAVGLEPTNPFGVSLSRRVLQPLSHASRYQYFRLLGNFGQIKVEPMQQTTPSKTTYGSGKYHRNVGQRK